jgi:hypothetical protein
MSDGDNTGFSIDPERTYPISAVAAILRVSERWVRENLVNNNSCAYKEVARTYAFRGSWINDWMNSDYQMPRDEDLCK